MENNEADLIWSLSWRQPEEVQRAAMEAIVSDPDFDPTRLLMPIGKAYWENAAICLRRMGYPRTVHALNGMLGWLKDMNWPGADVILSFLECYPKEALRLAYEKAVAQAVKDRDRDWLEGLSCLAREQRILREHFKNPRLYDTVVQSIRNTGKR